MADMAMIGRKWLGGRGLCGLAMLLVSLVLTVFILPAHADITWQQTGGPEGGSIYALAIDPATPQTIYAGTGSGVYTSTNGGTTWNAMSSGLPTTLVSTLAIDPATPQTIYAGTVGDGVFKSTNGGTSWAAVNSGVSSTNPSALAIDPTTPQTVYAGTGGGVFKSTNGGTS
jgi:photosystem II stability/assembly factor-like uncharacterized protein